MNASHEIASGRDVLPAWCAEFVLALASLPEQPIWDLTLDVWPAATRALIDASFRHAVNDEILHARRVQTMAGRDASLKPHLLVRIIFFDDTSEEEQRRRILRALHYVQSVRRLELATQAPGIVITVFDDPAVRQAVSRATQEIARLLVRRCLEGLKISWQK